MFELLTNLVFVVRWSLMRMNHENVIYEGRFSIWGKTFQYTYRLMERSYGLRLYLTWSGKRQKDDLESYLWFVTKLQCDYKRLQYDLNIWFIFIADMSARIVLLKRPLVYLPLINPHWEKLRRAVDGCDWLISPTSQAALKGF